MDLYGQLSRYGKEDYYPFHMPGHKRNQKLLQRIYPEGFPSFLEDITEIDGFDNLHHAQGVLREAQKRASQFYGAAYSWYSVGGSTAAILAAISACVCRGDKILMARNCHLSVYHAAELLELEPVYLLPQQAHDCGILGSVTADTVRAVLCAEKQIRMIVITSPTYEGVISEIKEIAEAAHEYGIPLLVDEAHGAHLGFHPFFPEGSVKSGADLVVHSVHKTLPCFTQTALLHLQGTIVSADRVQDMLSLYMTTSPSYLLMASIDRIISFLTEESTAIFESYAVLLKQFYKETESLKSLCLIKRSADGKMQQGKERVAGWDPSKLLIAGKGSIQSGVNLERLLREEYALEFEMSSMEYLLGMTSIADTEEGLERLSAALSEIDGRLCDADRNTGEKQSSRVSFKFMIGEPVWKPSEALSKGRHRKTVILPKAEGEAAAGYIYAYPPGIPILVPGERITGAIIRLLEEYVQAGVRVCGIAKNSREQINIQILTES